MKLFATVRYKKAPKAFRRNIMTSVFVSGATGFIAQHIVKQLIENKYKVVGSVRTAAKGDQLVEYFGSNFQYELVPDLSSKGAFDEALKKHPEVTVFLHTASPVTVSASDLEKDILIPAQNGTLSALEGVYKYAPQVKRLVVTSSYVAIWDLSKEYSDHSYLQTEKSWNPVTIEDAKSNALMAYSASKTFAEKSAWKFVEEKKPNFALSVINPSYVFGPQVSNAGVKNVLNFSSELVNQFLKLKSDDDLPEIQGYFVDVRDVARAHLAAFEKEETKGHRLVLATEPFIAQTIADIIHNNFADAASNVPLGNPGKKVPVEDWARVDFSETRKLQGFEPIGLEQSVNDSLEQIFSKR